MSKFKKSLQRAERFRANMVVTIGLLVLVGTLSLKYPLAFLGFLILGLAYAIYRIIKDRKNDQLKT
jgi:ABC-type enterochelin transport system permease subunit